MSNTFLKRTKPVIHWSFLSSLLCVAVAQAATANTFNPAQFGAIPNDDRTDTAAIQKAIDECTKSGGGTVQLSGGRFIAGSLRLKDGVTLAIGKDSILQASLDQAEFSDGVWIQSVNSSDVGISGPGKLEGNGSRYFRIRFGSVLTWLRDGARSGAVKHPVAVEGTLFTYMLQFVECNRVRLHNVVLADSQHWTVHCLGCRDVDVSKVRIRNVPYGPYTDGINIDSSSEVRVVDCDVTAGDDAFCVKTTGKRGIRLPARDIRFERCVARSPTNGFKIGTETLFDISDVTFRDCKIEPAIPGIGPIGGLTITSVDGARLSRITFEKIEIKLVRCPIFVRLGNRGRGQPIASAAPGSITGVVVKDVRVVSCSMPAIISGIPDSAIRDVTLEGIRLNRFGKSAQIPAASVPENPRAYPEATMFGQVSGRFLYCRHVDGMRLRKLTVTGVDAHPPAELMVTSDISRLDGHIVVE